MTKPTVGRIVHFVPPQKCTAESTLAFYAAIITQVNPSSPYIGDKGESCELATFGPTSLYFQSKIPYAAEYTPGCWSWPPREQSTVTKPNEKGQY